jgi:hypothetical protein
MAGEVVFRKVQWGKESSAAHGTSVAASRLILGTCNVPKDQNVTFIHDLNGRRGGANRTAVYQRFVDGLTLDLPHGYFQALPGIFSACLKGDLTPATATSANTWTFTPIFTSTASNMVDSLTLRVGDDVQCYVMPYTMFRSVVIAGSAGGDAPVQVTANGFARYVSSTGSFTTTGAAATTPAVEPMVANVSQLWVNNTFSVLGSGNAISNTLVDFNIEINGGIHPKFMADGQLYFSTHGQGDIGLVATFTFEGNSTADGYYDLYRAQTPKAIRFVTKGALIGGSLYHTLQIDAYGKFEEVIPLAGDRDGNSLHTAIFRSMDDGTNAVKVTVITVATAV